MLRAIRTLVLTTLFGALGTALVRFLYKAYDMMSQGMRRDAFPLPQLLEHMSIDIYLVAGAMGGAALGMLIVIVRLIGWTMDRARRPKEDEGPSYDPDAILREERERKVERYMEERGQPG